MTANCIAIILHDFSTGGSERIAIRLANAWAAKGRKVILLCGTEQGAARQLVSPHVAVEACSPETTRSPWSRLQLGWRLAKLIRKHKPEIVFSPGNFHLIILAILARLTFVERPVFLSKLSNPVRRQGLRARLEGLADAAIRFAAKPVDALIAMSPALGEEARTIFGGKYVVEIGEPILENERVTLSPGAAPDERLIMCIGRLCPQKDFITAIRAFAEIKRPANARLLILGEGPKRQQLEAEAKRLGVAARIEMPGYVADVTPWLAKARMLLMTSHYEGYPAVLVEAIAAGLPIVTTDCSLAIREIISSSELGSIVGSRDPFDIARAIEARFRLPIPGPDVIAHQTANHRIGASSAVYLDLFDQLAA
jgi:glycosyltransferase involved in cell wall biosynthesis